MEIRPLLKCAADSRLVADLLLVPAMLTLMGHLMLRESLRLDKVNRGCSLPLSYLCQSGSITLREQGSLASVGGRRCASLQAKGSPIVAQLDTFSYCLKVIVKLSQELSSFLRSLLNHQ